jgi:FtsP/CotA-like multicopper oxidase with cupredoxin domain
MINRRQILRAGLVGASSMLLPTRRASAQTGMFAPFQVPLPIPPELTPTTSRKGGGGSLTITQQQADVQILPGGPTTRVWTYNGTYPGPTIRARRGQPLTVRHYNNLPDPTVVHLHGAHTPPASDGFPTDFIMPGGFRDYYYPNDDERGGHVLVPRPRAGRHRPPRVRGPVRLLHPHRLGRGQPAAAQGAVRHPLCLQDRSFYPDGSLYYNSFDYDGNLGDHFLVNGAITPYLAVQRRKYRFRLLNGSNARVYVLRLTNREKFTVIASDGGLLERPDVTDELIIAPSERYDIVIDFAQYPLGTRLVLLNHLEQSTGKDADVDDLGYGRPVMAFDVAYNLGRRQSDTSSVPDVLHPIPRLRSPTRPCSAPSSSGAPTRCGRSTARSSTRSGSTSA